MLGMTTALEKILYVPDTHRPYHDKRAWRLFMQAAKMFKPSIIIVMGDFEDFYSISRFSKSPHRDRRLKWEVTSVHEGLNELDALKAKQKIYLGGNHTDRLRRYLEEKAPELFDVIDIPTLLQLEARGWRYIPYGKHFRLGKVYHTHDVGATGRYACHKALDTYKKGIVTGHVHRIGYVVEGNISGDTQISANFGWLGNVKDIDYAQEGRVGRDSALGFGLGYLNPKTGFVYLVPVPIIKYTCLVEGRLLQG